MDMVYDVDVLVTEDTPEFDFCSGPLSGGFIEPYEVAQRFAEVCNGSWADWEPYRCTYNFPDEESQGKFCEILDVKFTDHYKMVYEKKEPWDRDEDE